MGYKIRGWLLLLALSIVTVLLYVASFSGGFNFFHLPSAHAARILGLLGAIFLSLNFILSARYRVVESYFGGLDKVYRFHHLIGTAALVFMTAHPVIMALNVFPDAALVGTYLIPGGEFSYNMGILAIYSLLAILFFTFVVRLPYPAWLSTHRLLGLPLLLAFIHTLYIGSDISGYLPLRLWITGFFLMALISYVYKVLFFQFFNRPSVFNIVGLHQLHNILEIWLEPVSGRFHFLPGQFVFVTFPSFNHEEHPFSISSPPDGGHIRLSVKTLGDYTSALTDLNKGLQAFVTGPHGYFFRPFFESRPLVMIAGGIGITPFLGMLGNEVKNPRSRPVLLYYSVSTAADAVYLDELNTYAAQSDNITIYPHFTDVSGYLTADIILKRLSVHQNYNFLICGPRAFMDSMSVQLRQKGISRGRIYYENFNFFD